MKEQRRQEWDNRYKGRLNTQSVAAVLEENVSLLPKEGLALDIGCGTGANSFFLASLGMEVRAWDFSKNAINAMKGLLKSGEKIYPEEVAISPTSFEKNKFDLILCCHFLDRAIIQAIHDAAAPGGLIIYQTFSSEKKDQIGPSNPEFLLNYRELFFFVGKCEVLSYREQLVKRSGRDKMAGKAYIIGKKTS
tara:strand:- start:656 stop:1231 length:576 start_codon:yes stop_codon:yes gene_type:complete